MLYLGLIKANDPTSLIDPKDFYSVDEMYAYLTSMLAAKNFSMSVPITKELLEDTLKLEKPMIINFAESTVSLMMGEKEVIFKNTSRFVNTGLSLLDAFTRL